MNLIQEPNTVSQSEKSNPLLYYRLHLKNGNIIDTKGMWLKRGKKHIYIKKTQKINGFEKYLIEQIERITVLV